MKTFRTLCHTLMALTLITLTSCRPDDDDTIPSQQVKVDMGKGSFYLLNEGSWGSNKSTLDYYDAATHTYHRNIFAERNPHVVGELGDMGNELQIYNGRLWAVMNGSNLIEVMDAATALHIGQISIPNCRHIIFDGRHAYVTSYAGAVGMDPNAQQGYVARIDIDRMEITGTCTVGYQPEGMALYDGRLYVANSGGYRAPNYDNTISVIDLETFTISTTIEVGLNLHRIVRDSQDYLWVSSRGDYMACAPKTYVVDPRTNMVCDSLDLAISGMALAGDSLYISNSDWSTGLSNYHLINTRTRKSITDRLITDSIRVPYGIAVHPITRDIYITDAGDYVNPGQLYSFHPGGERRNHVRTGNLPAHIAFCTSNP